MLDRHLPRPNRLSSQPFLWIAHFTSVFKKKAHNFDVVFFSSLLLFPYKSESQYVQRNVAAAAMFLVNPEFIASHMYYDKCIFPAHALSTHFIRNYNDTLNPTGSQVKLMCSSFFLVKLKKGRCLLSYSIFRFPLSFSLFMTIFD